MVLNLGWPPAQIGYLLCELLSVEETHCGGLEVLALLGHGPETGKEAV